MKFKINESIDILSRTAHILETMLKGLPEGLLKNNEGANTWSPYDVIGHLIHGEKTDWLVRTKVILSQSEDKNFIPFDRFAQMNSNGEKKIETLLTEFENIRTQNLKELKALQIKETDYSKTGIHPEFGEITLRQLLSTWVVHDLGHIAQVSRVMAKQYKAEVGPWTAYLKILE